MRRIVESWTFFSDMEGDGTMTVDAHGMSHRPKGTPDGGQYETGFGVGGDADLDTAPAPAISWTDRVADSRNVWTSQDGRACVRAGHANAHDVLSAAQMARRFHANTGFGVIADLDSGTLLTEHDGTCWTVNPIDQTYGRDPADPDMEPLMSPPETAFDMGLSDDDRDDWLRLLAATTNTRFTELRKGMSVYDGR